MITNTNTASLTTCDVWRENTIGKHDQRCSACKGFFNIVKYIVYTAYTSETVLLHGVNQLIQSFKREKRMLLSTSTSTTTAHCVGQTVDLPLFNNPMHF